MKKVFGGLLATVLALGIGTAAFADGNGNGTFELEDMIPFMQESHPDWSEDDVEQMYNSCHSDGEGVENSFYQNMMNF